MLLPRIGDQGGSEGRFGVIDFTDSTNKKKKQQEDEHREKHVCDSGDDKDTKDGAKAGTADIPRSRSSSAIDVHAHQQENSYNTRADRRCSMDTTPLNQAVRFPSQLPDIDLKSSSDMEKVRRRRFRSTYAAPLLTCVVAAIGLIALFGIVHSYMTRQLDPTGCKTPRMLPTYVRLDGFDTEHTRFSRKYSLYLYRERGVDHYDEDDLGVR